MDSLHVAPGRHVFTYEPQGRAAGLLTAYEHGGGWVLEHVVAWRPGALRPMLFAALDWAAAHGVAHVAFTVPHDRPDLVRLAERFGAERYGEAEGVTFYVWRLLAVVEEGAA